jgi:dTDP-D-glucose 4,6-dehydratase
MGVCTLASAGKVYSIGSEDCYSNLDVARRLLKAFGLEDQESDYLEFVEDRKFNDLRCATPPSPPQTNHTS